MADKKISALTSATTPLAGTEVLPIVQSGTTVKVPVSDLTAGRTVSASGLTVTGSSGSLINADFSSTPVTNRAAIQTSTTNGNTNVSLIPNGTGNRSSLQVYSASDRTNASLGSLTVLGASSAVILESSKQGTGTYFPLQIFTSGVNQVQIETTGDVTVKTGNLVQGTAAKGINFTANTPAAGKTSTLLNWYEEGTWTPNTTWATFVGAASSSGTYTRIGRMVTVNGTLTGATSVTVGASGILTSDLPFTASYDAIGSMAASTNTASGVVRVTGVYVVAVTTMSPVASITFTATYFV